MDDIAVAAGLGLMSIMLFYAVLDSAILATILGLGLAVTGFIFLNNWYH